MAKSECKTVDQYLAAQPDSARPVLERVRTAIRKAAPKAEESISYKMPTYKLNGSPLIYFAGWKQHYSRYPVSAALLAELAEPGTEYQLEKSTIRFPFALPVPVKLIKQIVRLRARELSRKLQSSDSQK